MGGQTSASVVLNRLKFAGRLGLEAIMTIKSLEDLFKLEIQDLYDAENQIIKALPDMIDAAASPQLRDALSQHLEETREHANRLEQVFSMMGEKAKREKCAGMKGIIEEGDDLIDDDSPDAVRDAVIISAAQKVEHYEIAAYGCVRTYASELNLPEAAELLQQTLDEEEAADRKLTQVAEQRNRQARRAA